MKRRTTRRLRTTCRRLRAAARRERSSCGFGVTGHEATAALGLGGQLPRGASPERLGEQHLHVADPRFGEARLAERQVEAPGATEPLVVAELLEPVDGLLEALSPRLQGEHVAR